MIKTTCKDCIFATWQDNKQIGCRFNRLEKFDQAYLTTFVDDHYEIKGICNYCRNKEWASKINISILQQLQRETAIKLDIIVINSQTDKSCIEAQIKNIIHTIRKNHILPQSIIFSSIVSIDYKWYITIIEKYIGVGIKYHVVNPFETNSPWDVLDICITRAKGHFIFSCYLNTKLDVSNVIDLMNQEYNDNCGKFLAIDSMNEIDGFVVQRSLAKLLGGSANGCLRDKVLTLNSQQKANMVLHWNLLDI